MAAVFSYPETRYKPEPLVDFNSADEHTTLADPRVNTSSGSWLPFHFSKWTV